MTPADATRYRNCVTQCRLASSKLLPCLIVGPPDKRHVVRALTEYMPAEPPDDSPSAANIEIDGHVYTMGASLGGSGHSSLIASMRAGTWSGFSRSVIGPDGQRQRVYSDGRVERDEVPEWFRKARLKQKPRRIPTSGKAPLGDEGA